MGNPADHAAARTALTAAALASLEAVPPRGEILGCAPTELPINNGERNGNQPKRFTTVRQRLRRLFHRDGLCRSAAQPARTGPRERRQRHLRTGRRTVWHSHPLGQTLIITAGCGRVQREGEPVEEIRPGDVVWIPPGVKHWHGAAPTTAMTHIAIQEKLDGKPVDWMEQISDEQYQAGLAPDEMSCHE